MYRKERVARLIRNVIGEALLHHMSDPRISTLTSVSRVDVSADLQVAKIYLTVMGDETTERKTLAGICHAGGYLQRLVASNLTLRHCPELRFEVDSAAKLAKVTIALLDKNREENPRLFAEAIEDATESALTIETQHRLGDDASESHGFENGDEA